jgi:hypothetical protein
MAFVKAVKTQAKIRLALAGPSGSGKTFTALMLATALADGGKVAVIDTERGSASKYSDTFDFDVMEMDSYHPDRFTAGIKEAQEAGYAVLVIDSLSHAWNGLGGLLEIVEGIAKRSKSGNSFNAWNEATPIQNRLIDTITRSNMHIICTMRSKQEYILEQVNGKNVPRKVGMAPVQRNDLEYEFDVFGEMDYENTLIIQKSRCSALSGAVISKPDAKVADVLKNWLSGAPAPEKVYALPSSNEEVPAATEQQLSTIRKLCEHLHQAVPLVATFEEAKDWIAKLSQEYRENRTKAS